MPLGDPWDNTAPGAIAMQWTAKVVGTANLTIATALVPGQVIDGYTLVAGDVVLLIGQTTQSQNGLYISAATPLRHPLFDDNTEVGAGIAVTIQAGSVGANKEYELVTPAPIIVGTTSLTFSQATVTAATLPTQFQAWDNTGAAAEGINITPLPVFTPIACARSGNVNIPTLSVASGTQIDFVSFTAGDLVALLAQSNPTENGLYTIGATNGTTVRYAPFDQQAEAEAGCRIKVLSGSSNIGKSFVLITQRPIQIGATALTFTEITPGAAALPTPFTAFDNTAPVPKTV